ncbi:hypothetical protein Vadar_011409 [Vaccinium darrowii]|uniref:Uncharacterized protein n=1 Tax=Vaccinium darrowii TaxID=229202 RepID=A0ACB7X922_9ERIC|nr:hypothetical protein Vadar_011409 [Vaccinium darrowii]
MSARSSGRVSFKPDTNEKTRTSHKQSAKRSVSGETNGGFPTTSCRFRIPRRSELSPLRLLRRIGDTVAAALRFVSIRRRRRSFPNNACSSGRSNPSIAPLDAYRAEAINDCIEFINKSCSLQRSNSVTTNPCQISVSHHAIA